MNIKETQAVIENALTHPYAARDALQECRTTIDWLVKEAQVVETYHDSIYKEFDDLSSDVDCPKWMTTRIREILNG